MAVRGDGDAGPRCAEIAGGHRGAGSGLDDVEGAAGHHIDAVRVGRVEEHRTAGPAGESQDVPGVQCRDGDADGRAGGPAVAVVGGEGDHLRDGGVARGRLIDDDGLITLSQNEIQRRRRLDDVDQSSGGVDHRHLDVAAVLGGSGEHPDVVAVGIGVLHGDGGVSVGIETGGCDRDDRRRVLRFHHHRAGDRFGLGAELVDRRERHEYFFGLGQFVGVGRVRSPAVDGVLDLGDRPNGGVVAHLDDHGVTLGVGADDRVGDRAVRARLGLLHRQRRSRVDPVDRQFDVDGDGRTPQRQQVQVRIRRDFVDPYGETHRLRRAFCGVGRVGEAAVWVQLELPALRSGQHRVFQRVFGVAIDRPHDARDEPGTRRDGVGGLGRPRPEVEQRVLEPSGGHPDELDDSRPRCHRRSDRTGLQPEQCQEPREQTDRLCGHRGSAWNRRRDRVGPGGFQDGHRVGLRDPLCNNQIRTVGLDCGQG